MVSQPSGAAAPDYAGFVLQQNQLSNDAKDHVTFSEYQLLVGWRLADWLAAEFRFGRGLGDERLVPVQAWQQVRSQPQYSGLLRAGYAPARRLELFAFAGLQAQEFRLKRVLQSKTEFDRVNRTAAVAGAGVAWALTARWRVALEYRRGHEIRFAEQQWRQTSTGLSLSYLFP